MDDTHKQEHIQTYIYIYIYLSHQKLLIVVLERQGGLGGGQGMGGTYRKESIFTFQGKIKKTSLDEKNESPL